MNDFITIAKYNTAAEANVAKSELEAAEIDCFIENENGVYSPQNDCVRLKIWAGDKEKALEILNLNAELSDGNDEKADAETICPYCKSSDTTYGVNRSKANILFVVLTFFLQSLPWYKKKTYYCNNCNRHFKVEENNSEIS